MRIIVLVCIAIFPVSGLSQDRPYKPVLADLFRRAQSSELIAIVTVAERRPVRTQISDEELFRLGDMNKGYGGSLYVLQVEGRAVEAVLINLPFQIGLNPPPSGPYQRGSRTSALTCATGW